MKQESGEKHIEKNAGRLRFKSRWISFVITLIAASAAMLSFYLLRAGAGPEKLWEYDLGQTAGPMELVDMDGDGEKELFIVGDTSGGYIRLINPKTGQAYPNGTGTFNIGSNGPIANITTGDWDGTPGTTEVMVPTGQNSPGVRVYRFDGTQLVQIDTVNTNREAYAVAFGDFWDNDSGACELIVGMSSNKNRYRMDEVAVYRLSDESERVKWQPNDFSSMVFAPNHLVNSNYYVLALGGGNNNSTRLYKRGTTSGSITVGNNVSETKIVAENFSSTSYKDFILTSKNGSSSKVYVINASNANLVVNHTAPDSINDFVTGDVNSDGTPDIVIGTSTSDRRLRVINGANSTVLASSPQYASTVRAVASGEVDGDSSTVDVVAGTASDGIYSLYYNGTGTLQQKAKSFSPADNVYYRYNMLLFDVNSDKDGIMDIIVGEMRNNGVANVEAFTLDQIPPVIAAPNPGPGNISDVTGATYSPQSTFNVSLDESAFVTIKIFSDAARTGLVHTVVSDYEVTGSGGQWDYSTTWDGSGNTGSGTYYYSITATDNETGVKPAVDYTTNTAVYDTGSLELDMTAPTAAINMPAADGETVTGLVTITGTAADDLASHFMEYSVDYEEYGAGNWANIASGVSGVNNDTLGTWDTTSPEYLNGDYRIRLTVNDRFGHTTTVYRRVNVVNDTTGPEITLRYYKEYSGGAFSVPLETDGGIPVTSVGPVYIKVYSNEPLNSVPKITINDSTNNNRTSVSCTKVSDYVYMYQWDIVDEGIARSTATVAVEAYDLYNNATDNATQVSGKNVIIDTYADSTTMNAPLFNALTGDVELTWSPVADAREYRIWRQMGSPGVDTGGLPYQTVSEAAYNDPVGAITQDIYYVVKVVDIAGNVSGVSNEVMVSKPEPATLTVAAYPAAVVADGAESSIVTASLEDQYGNPMEGYQINFSTTLGNLSAASAVTDSGGDAVVSITSGVTGTAAVTGTVNGAPAVEGSASVDFTPPAANIIMSASLNNIPANNTTASTIKATVRDGDGNYLADGTIVRFAITSGTATFSDGTIIKDAAVSGGLGEAAVQVKSNTVNTVTIQATAAGAAGSANVNFVSPAVTSMNISASTTTIYADGEENSVITATLFDQYSVPMPGVDVNFTTNLGFFTPGNVAAKAVTTDANGNAVVTLKSLASGTAEVTASSEGVSREVQVILEVPDTTPPSLLRAEPTNKQLIYLTFSEPVKFDTPVNWYIYNYVNGSLIGDVAYDQNPETVPGDRRVVRLVLADGVNQGAGNQYPNPETYKVVVNGVTDLYDNEIVTDGVYNTAEWDAYSPHGKYGRLNASEFSNPTLCGQCHRAHDGSGEQLLSKNTIKEVCFVCHGTDGISVYSVEDEFTGRPAPYAVSMHKALDDEGYNVLYCTDCHNPHGDRRSGTNNIFPKLLKAVDVAGNVYYGGNGYCLACHGANDTGFKTGNTMQAYYDITGGDHRWGMTADSGGPIPHYNYGYPVMAPNSGIEITCIKCHERHGSGYSSLLDNSRANGEEEQCYKCHGKDSNYSMTLNYNVYDKITNSLSQHKVGNTVFGKIECTNCHGPHTVDSISFASSSGSTSSVISNPDNTKEPFTTASGDMTDFCLKCHDGMGPSRTVSSAAVVPYDVTFNDIGFTSNGGGWNKDGPTLSYKDSKHYTIGKQCTFCHDWHGTDYRWLLVAPEDQADNTSGICFKCHAGIGAIPDVNSVLKLGYKHPTLTYSGRHSNTENYYRDAESTQAVRHAECYDCHDVHTVKSTSTTQMDKLGNVSGVKFDQPGWGNWSSAAASFIYLDPVTNNKQAYLCYKCHSKYAYTPATTQDSTGTAPFNTPSSVSGYSQGQFLQTDLAKEFNPANPNYHAVEGASKMPTFTYNGQTYYYGKFVNGWTATSPMKCTDCHNKASGDSGGNGPHGSSNRFLLIKPWDVDPNSSTMTGKTGTQDHLCFECHDWNFYAVSDQGSATVRSAFSGDGKYNLHVGKDDHRTTKESYGCASCHGAVPHGWRYKNAVWDSSAPRPYKDGQFTRSGDEYYIPYSTTPNGNASSDPGQWTKHNYGDCQGACGKN